MNDDVVSSTDLTPTRRVIFSIASLWFFRNFAPVIEELALRGHDVCLHLMRDDKEPSACRRLEALLARYPSISVRYTPEREDFWAPLSQFTAKALDYMTFREDRFNDKPVLRVRAEARTPVALRFLFRALSSAPLRSTATRILSSIEASIPISVRTAKFFAGTEADLVVVSPLIDVGTRQYEHLRAAKAAGVPTLFAVHSWDNLSCKARVRHMPEAVAVWNEIQVAEAQHFHSIAPSRVRAVGAATYDQWFNPPPVDEGRTSFLEGLGLDATKPTVLYLASAIFGFREPPEPTFFRDWLVALRTSDVPSLKEVNVIVRPHPRRGAEWAAEAPQLAALSPEHFAVFPEVSENPADAFTASNYMKSLLYADAVVGINTSAMIEAALLGKPVLTILDPRYRDSQSGTFHFDYLTKRVTKNGIVRVSSGIQEHIAALSRALSESSEERTSERAFAIEFVRPHEPDRPAASVFANYIEALCSTRPAPAHGNWHISPPILVPFAVVINVADLIRRVARWASTAKFSKLRRGLR
ncbi:MAG TPA: hypothetical protein VGU45_17455 [Microvirga sp.]|jgi:hypothetical protein|nr:hypothetical protein [Microvirga sp.]